VRVPKRVVWLLAGVAVLLLVAGVGLVLLRDPAPDAAGLPEQPDAPGAVAVPDASSVGEQRIDGTWVVQPGPEVWAGYRVQEQWVNQSVERTVVGRTPAVGGSAELTGPYLARASFDVDLTQLRSGWDERDAEMQLVLDTAQFPTASLALLEPVRIPAVLEVGTPIAVEVPATLTIKGVTQPVLLSVQGRWNGDTLDVAGSTDIGLADFGIDPGTAGGLVSVGGEGTVEFVVRLTRG
jgi:polyisoprenoid-binding protein YceI